MDIYLSEKTHQKLCELFDVVYQPMEFDTFISVGKQPSCFFERGLPHTEETKQLLSEIVRKQMSNPDMIKLLSDKSKEAWKNPNSIFNTPEYREKLSTNNPRYWTGKPRYEETKEKLREANLGKKQSEETKLKRIETRKNNGKKPNYKDSTCPHCNLTGKAFNMTRYHFDNCKKKVNI